MYEAPFFTRHDALQHIKHAREHFPKTKKQGLEEHKAISCTCIEALRESMMDSASSGKRLRKTQYARLAVARFEPSASATAVATMSLTKNEVEYNTCMRCQPVKAQNATVLCIKHLFYRCCYKIRSYEFRWRQAPDE